MSYWTSFCRIVSHISNVVGQSGSNNKLLVTLSVIHIKRHHYTLGCNGRESRPPTEQLFEIRSEHICSPWSRYVLLGRCPQIVGRDTTVCTRREVARSRDVRTVGTRFVSPTAVSTLKLWIIHHRSDRARRAIIKTRAVVVWNEKIKTKNKNPMTVMTKSHDNEREILFPETLSSSAYQLSVIGDPAPPVPPDGRTRTDRVPGPRLVVVRRAWRDRDARTGGRADGVRRRSFAAVRRPLCGTGLLGGGGRERPSVGARAPVIFRSGKRPHCAAFELVTQ